MLEIVQIPVLKDNYTYVLHDPLQRKTAVVDPAEAEPVFELLKIKDWDLDYIFNTHHHHDHVGGNYQLKKQTNCKIIASKFDSNRIPEVDLAMDDGDVFNLGSCEIKVLSTPGHTHGHLCYFDVESQALFCGDTLFSLGCGRLFEGTATELWSSLQKIKTLPIKTKIYCAHEYTLANADFALSIDPKNALLVARYQQIISLRQKGLATIPVSLEEELQTNPFLRTDLADFDISNTNKDTEIARFAQLRLLKDAF